MKIVQVVSSLTLGLILWAAGAAHSATIYVKASATGANNGTSWTNAYTDLQSALAAAQWGDEILVAAGTYKPTTGTDRSKSFVMTAGVGIYGGFAGTETTREQRNWTSHVTILSGDIGSQGGIADNSYHVVGGGYNGVLDGFTITAGTGGTGGGMINSSVSPTVANCTFVRNWGDVGGGMYNVNAFPVVSNCAFTSNTASNNAGGMFNNKSSPVLSNCIFNGNKATAGGGMYNSASGSKPKLTNCIFIGNTAQEGGGLANSYGSSILFDCVFTGNKAYETGGGIYNSNSVDAPIITNCTFIGNRANEEGGGIYNSNASPTVTNSILWGNSSTIGPEVYKVSGALTFHYCDIQGSGGSGSQWNPALGTDGGGNIMANPLFVNASDPAGPDGIWRTADDGLALTADSPCIDAGTNTNAPTFDILDKPRPVDGNSDGQATCDIGAYEFQSGGTPPDPPTTPEGRLALTYTITKPSTVPAGQTVQYLYHWTSDGGDNVSHGPTTATSDTLTEMDLVQAGETWTISVTPSYGSVAGTPSTAKVKILNPQNGTDIWILYQ